MKQNTRERDRIFLIGKQNESWNPPTSSRNPVVAKNLSKHHDPPANNEKKEFQQQQPTTKNHLNPQTTTKCPNLRRKTIPYIPNAESRSCSIKKKSLHASGSATVFFRSSSGLRLRSGRFLILPPQAGVLSRTSHLHSRPYGDRREREGKQAG